MGQIFAGILADKGFQGAFLSTLIMILLGYVLYHAGILESRGKNMLTAVIWKIAVPCMAFDAFMAPFDPAQFSSQIYVFILSFILYFALYYVSKFILRRFGKDVSVVGAAIAAIGQVTIFSMPILLSMYDGQGDAAISISIMTLPFRVMVYVVSFFAISGLRIDKNSFLHSVKGILINPIMIAMLFGLAIWLSQGFMPRVSVDGEAVSFLRIDRTLSALYKTVTSLKALVSPLSMLLIGMSLADSDMKSAFRDKLAWGISLMRTIAAPLVTAGLILLVQTLGITHFSGETVVAMVIGFAAPASATVSLFAIQYQKAALLSSRVCLISTVICIASIPISYLVAKAVLLFPVFS